MAKISFHGIVMPIVMACLAGVHSYAQTTFTGVATYFDGLGTPYGACGVPQNLVDSENFVALNVYHSPGVGTMWPRPITNANSAIIGEYNNGLNCDRWMKVTIMENCIGGINDGALGQAFCRNGGQWQNDIYSESTLYMVVTDACGDNNGWCRDSRYHLDLHRPSLPRFSKNGVPSTNMFPTQWNNRMLKWEYVKAPNYKGDVDIYFMQAAQTYWPAIMINHLENGIHGVEQKINGQWVTVSMNSDMGQSYILNSGPGPYTIRIKDADGNYVKNGREYTFNNPCSSPCSPAVTPATYTTFNPTVLELHQQPSIQTKKTNDGWKITGSWAFSSAISQSFLLCFPSQQRIQSHELNPNPEWQLDDFQAEEVQWWITTASGEIYSSPIRSLSGYSKSKDLMKKIDQNSFLSSSNSEAWIHVFDTKGNEMLKTTISPKGIFTFPPQLSPGLYIIWANDGQYQSQLSHIQLP